MKHGIAEYLPGPPHRQTSGQRNKRSVHMVRAHLAPRPRVQVLQCGLLLLQQRGLLQEVAQGQRLQADVLLLRLAFVQLPSESATPPNPVTPSR